ncbi:MAG: hypothetical protein KIT80_02040 [Chitinophagaceae bacterium]|nr:hypothetical protein [Chitinophagaceae bacterium]MCW5925665.1 hypothetical protein [Chitinophagaceae bacterium]
MRRIMLLLLVHFTIFTSIKAQGDTNHDKTVSPGNTYPEESVVTLQSTPVNPESGIIEINRDSSKPTVFKLKQQGDTTQPKFGRYTVEEGFTVVQNSMGVLRLKLYTYARYINQKGFDPAYTDAFGRMSEIKQRQDIQLCQVQLTMSGWVFTPKFRYLGYVWSANTSQGELNQVVLAGNLNYDFNRHFTFGVGIQALPGVRTTEGNFPFWLPVDNRLIADEFFRPSYTSGIWLKGEIVKGLNYHAMLGNNLNQFGISADQLDNKLKTIATALMWMPTTKEFDNGGYGDFNMHQKLATRLAVHYTSSLENRTSQPKVTMFENTQLRLSDGNVIFEPGLFGTGISIEDARYQMVSLDAGVKYKGFSLDAGFYQRWLNGFRGSGTESLKMIKNNGFAAIGSAMIVKKMLQVYTGGSKIFGEYGNPWDYRIGANYYPWKNQAAWFNTEYIYLRKSPVGNSSLPYVVGANGGVFLITFFLYL